MLLKKLRQEKVVMGVGGSGAVGWPSSSTSGAGWGAIGSIGGGVGARCRRIGGGRASSSDESSMWVGLRLKEMADGALREMERQ
jgi:hypothetical protein